MIKNVYYKGELIPVEDWDFENKRPKLQESKPKKSKSKKAEITPEPETQVEVNAFITIEE